MYNSQLNSITEHENNEQFVLDIERIYCSYCKIEISIQSEKDKNSQVCSSCEFILNNSNYLVFNLHPDLNVQDIEAVKLLELKLNVILPILDVSLINEFAKDKFGIIINENKVIGLFLDNINLKRFPDEINYFKNLKFLSMNNTKLFSLPESIDQLSNLELLILRENNIEFLPDSMVNLHHLKIVDISKNQLRLLPDNFGELKVLSYLNLEYNLLYCLPKSFKNLKKLKILNVFDNQIKMDLIVDLLPKNLLKCGIGGNCLSNQSMNRLMRFFKKKCSVHTQKTSWLKNELQQLNLT